MTVLTALSLFVKSVLSSASQVVDDDLAIILPDFDISTIESLGELLIHGKVLNSLKKCSDVLELVQVLGIDSKNIEFGRGLNTEVGKSIRVEHEEYENDKEETDSTTRSGSQKGEISCSLIEGKIEHNIEEVCTTRPGSNSKEKPCDDDELAIVFEGTSSNVRRRERVDFVLKTEMEEEDISKDVNEISDPSSATSGLDNTQVSDVLDPRITGQNVTYLGQFFSFEDLVNFGMNMRRTTQNDGKRASEVRLDAVSKKAKN